MSRQQLEQPEILWQPSRETVAEAQMTRFARAVGLENAPYEKLHRFSVSDLEGFWGAFWDFAGVLGSRGAEVLRVRDEARMTAARFFPQARLNYAENMLAGDPDEVAVIETDEQGVHRETDLAELRRRVAHAQAALESLGVQSGDRVAGLLPNNVDALVMLLATASLGGVWSACAPEFGVSGILDRFGQIAPRVLVAAPEYLYNGRSHDVRGRLAEVAGRIDGLEHVLLTGAEQPLPELPCNHLWLQGFVCDDRPAPRYVGVPFDHPLYIIYTSGTTGLPKCIVHGVGGTLLTHRKEHMLHCDVKPGDRVFYYTNTAWMMYHWLISARASGAAIVLYDGSPLPKTPTGMDVGVLWRIAEEAGVTHFGTSPKYLSLVQQHAYAPGERHDLGRLRMIMSAGAPLTEEHFHWVYSEVKADLCLASISGGTEILGCFVMGNPTLPVRSGEIQCPALGMAVNVMDERNAPVLGRKHDLVCTEPFPSMPLTFWGEGGYQRYIDTYFGDREEIWTHGDLAEWRLSGGVVITGRTDTLLKPGGVRIGTAEIYRVVEALDEVSDSLVVGYPTDDDQEVWLYVVTAEGVALDEALERLIRERLRSEASPRHVPRRIMSVPAIPYTLSGKKVEKAVLQILTGRSVQNKASLSNPESLELFESQTGGVPS